MGLLDIWREVLMLDSRGITLVMAQSFLAAHRVLEY